MPPITEHHTLTKLLVNPLKRLKMDLIEELLLQSDLDQMLSEREYVSWSIDFTLPDDVRENMAAEDIRYGFLQRSAYRRCHSISRL